MGNIFGDFLKKLREDRKMTLREVERKAQISNAYLSQVERGERSIPTMKMLARLAKVYGVPVSVLTEKAEADLKHKKAGEKQDQKKKSELPAPDIEFICRGYENLTENGKQKIKDFLQFIAEKEKKK